MVCAIIKHTDGTDVLIKDVVWHGVIEGGLVKIITRCDDVCYLSVRNIYSLTILEEGDDK